MQNNFNQSYVSTSDFLIESIRGNIKETSYHERNDIVESKQWNTLAGYAELTGNDSVVMVKGVSPNGSYQSEIISGEFGSKEFIDIDSFEVIAIGESLAPTIKLNGITMCNTQNGEGANTSFIVPRGFSILIFDGFDVAAVTDKGVRKYFTSFEKKMFPQLTKIESGSTIKYLIFKN